MSVSIEIWGNNIWYLFHTIAHKIKEDKFDIIKNDLIEVIKNISKNLPCPDCAKDATELLNKINFDNIKTKKDFEILIFNFHNHVNKKLKKPLFEYENLSIKYKNANIYNLIHNFNIIFSSNSNNSHLMTQSFNRQQKLPKINILLKKILEYIE